MASLKDKIQQKIRKEREGLEQPESAERAGTNEPAARLDVIRPQLDDLPHTSDSYSLKVDYAVGPYSSDIAIIELYDAKDLWVARWEVAPTVGGSEAEWELTAKPGGSATYREWFRNDEDLFEYLTAAIAERVVRMHAGKE